MERTDFLKTSLLAGASLAGGRGLVARNREPLSQDELLQTHNFKLKYAPHFGMFRNHAGNDPVDQIHFMADLGFRGLEDNGMKGRDIATQEKIARTLEDRGRTMGVVVGHPSFWREPSLSTGNHGDRDRVTNESAEAEEAARRER